MFTFCFVMFYRRRNMADLEILPKRIDVLDASDKNCTFRINIDVLNECFGANKSLYMNACFPQGKHRFIPGTKKGEKFVVWMPKLYGNSSEWKNSISADNNTIHEVAENSRHTDWMDADKHDLDIMRLVFVKPDPSLPYVFKGVFVNGKMDFLNHTYHRIATKVRLIGNPVTRVELLDRTGKTTNNSKLESLCSRLDMSLSLDDTLKKKAEQFVRYVHDRDRNDGKIDFNNPKSILYKEAYKHILFERSQKALNINSWDESWINTGKIFEKLRPVILDEDNNLINYYNNRTDFNNHFIKGNDKYDYRSEKAIFEIFTGTDDRKSFEFAMDVFGKKYPTLGYLFFLKDDTRYLPLSPENFEKSFRELNINIKLQGNCSWQNYNEFIQIIDYIREVLPSLIELDHKPTLLEAHSFVWIIGQKDFTSWLNGQEYQRTKAIKEQRQKQEKEEYERNKALRIYLSDFSDEELLNIGPQIINHEIYNTLKGSARILGFSSKLPISMEIVYKSDEPGQENEPKFISLNDKRTRERYYFTAEAFKEIISGSIVKTDISEITAVSTTDNIIIPETEDEQSKQAAILPVDQLRAIAKEHETIVPFRREITTNQYKRDPYIAELAKREANGICQLCGMNAPFITSEGKPYLETHHIKWLSEGGADTIENTVAVCPNCHKRLHIFNDPDDVDFLKSLKQIVSD